MSSLQNPLNPFKGKVVVVTGASRGIGEACARSYYDQGARLVLVGRHLKDLKKLKLKDSLTVACDVSQETQVKDLFRIVSKKMGGVDVLVNNAGLYLNKSITSTSAEEWDKILGVNLRGVFLCSREAFRLMGKKKSGAIVNVSSLGGLRYTEKFPGTSAYVASKFGVVGLTEALASEGKTLGIRVNAIAPGAIQTQMLLKTKAGLQSKTKPSDVARLVLTLSDPSQPVALTGVVVELNSNLKA